MGGTRMGRQGSSTGVEVKGKVWRRGVEVGKQGNRQELRAQLFFQAVGTTTMDAGDGHGDEHVGGSHGRRRHTAVAFGEGTGGVIAA